MKQIETSLQHKIAKEFFLDFTNTTTVSKKIYPSLKGKNAGVVSSNFSKWKKKGYIEDGRIVKRKKYKKSEKSYLSAINAYKMNLNPYFDYTKRKLDISPKRKLSKVEWLTKLDQKKDSNGNKMWKEELLKELNEREFNKTEKEILEYIFSFKEMRVIACKDSNLFNGITRVLERLFFYKGAFLDNSPLASYFRKGFFIKNKKHIKLTKEIYFYRLKEIRKFEGVSNEYFRKLRKKIEIITDFSDENYFRFMAKSSLRKYQYMPSIREIMKEKDEKKRHMLVRTWIQLYFFDEMPEGYN